MYRRLAMLLALVALLLQTATVSAHGLMPAPQAGGDAIALCTPYGVKIVHVDEEGVPAGPRPHGGDDCALCLHAGGGAALMPLPLVMPVVVALAMADAPVPFRSSGTALYRSQNPRGPPG